MRYIENVLIIFSALILTCYGAFLSMFSLPGFPLSMASGLHLPYVADKPIGEDGYYMLLVAWNLAGGDGFTANFHAVTTGVQPLAVLIFGILARFVQGIGGDKTDFARTIIAFGSLNALVFSYFVARLAQALVIAQHERCAFVTAFILSSLSFYIFRTWTYGLETGIYLTLIAATMLYSFGFRSKKTKGLTDYITFGLLLGLTGLARIDFGIVVAAILLFLTVFRKVPLGKTFIIGLVALAVTMPWLFWVHSVSGSWIPSSGPAQASPASLSNFLPRLTAMTLALAQNAAPWLFIGGRLGPAVIALGGLAMFLWFVTRTKALSISLCRTNLSVLVYWALAILILPFIYLTMFWATHFYARYTSPLCVIALAVLGGLAAGIPPEMRKGFYIALFAVVAIFNGAFAFISLHTGAIGNSHVITAGYVARLLPPDKKVGAFQSGVIGYYNSNVVNLDGKLNEEALRATKEGRLEQYLKDEDIVFAVDWSEVIKGTLGDAIKAGRWVYCPAPVPNGMSVCVMQKSPL